MMQPDIVDLKNEKSDVCTPIMKKYGVRRVVVQRMIDDNILKIGG